ncbi:MAG: uncharacterized protein A8A55_2274, partial [Amphiamblys sp. WSBS2006]
MIQRGIVERVRHARWSSPVVLVPKGEGYRMCVDYRALNKVTHTERHPIPIITEVLEQLQGACLFSVLDLTKGFWQIPMEAGSREKTVFCTKKGKFAWNYMPFGLKNAPVIFQKVIDGVLDPVRYKFAIPYIDDIIIYSKTKDEHIQHLKAVAALLKEAGLKINAEKSKFLRSEVEYLGHVISADGVRPKEKNIAKILNIATPRTVKQLRAFLGMVNYYRDFVPHIAQKAACLYEITKKYSSFKWLPEHDKAFELLKSEMENNCTLAYPDFKKPFVVYTDASGDGLGGLLCQVDTEGNEKIIKCISRSLTPAEKNYGITELECLAIFWSLNKWKYYLQGREFKVVTDHKALKWLQETKSENTRLTRWK